MHLKMGLLVASTSAKDKTVNLWRTDHEYI